MKRSDPQRINDILRSLDAIEVARTYLHTQSENPDLEDIVLAAVTHHLFVIGEAAKSLSPEARNSLPELPWRDIIRQRDFIGHHYFKLESAAIWATIDRPLAQLKAALSG